MRVAKYYSNEDLRIEEMPRPQIGPAELLVRVEASGICGSDVMEWYRRDKVPLVLGHEISGIIEEAGKDVKLFKSGERVTCAHHVPCGACHYCLSGHETVCEILRRTNFDPGGFSEFVRLPAINVEKGVFRLPPNVSFEEGTFVEPLACVLRGQRLAGFKPQQSVLVLGCGIAGLLHIHLAKAMGAALVVATDISDYRLEAAKKFGADQAIKAQGFTPQMLCSLNQNKLADLVIVSVGVVSAISQALESVKRGGTVLFFAPLQKDQELPIKFNQLFWRSEITLTSSYAGSPQDYQRALELIAAKKIEVADLITHRLKLEEIGLGFKLVAEAGESLKVIIYPQR